jgi:transcriptional regulator with XRE-family HTH domain
MKKTGTVGGNRLRTLREYVGRTQLEVELEASLGMGYLQRVESGKVQHPERETIERILLALEARYTQRREILELFGYLVDAPLPADEDIEWATTVCRAELDTAVFPAYLLDCAHRLLVWNGMVPKLFPIAGVTHHSQTANRLSMLHLLFNPSYGVTPRIANPDVFFPASIRALRSEMQLFHSEPWYEGLIADLRSNCPVFEKYWTLSEARPVYHIAARPLTPLELILPDVGSLIFRLMAEPFLQDRRFRVIYYLPANPVTMQQCAEWSQSTADLLE